MAKSFEKGPKQGAREILGKEFVGPEANEKALGEVKTAKTEKEKPNFPVAVEVEKEPYIKKDGNIGYRTGGLFVEAGGNARFVSHDSEQHNSVELTKSGAMRVLESKKADIEKQIKDLTAERDKIAQLKEHFSKEQ